MFPRGACGDATLLLGALLADSGEHGFGYISAYRGKQSDRTWTSHAWLQKGNCVIDVTADQFADAPTPVIVASPSNWHAGFCIEQVSSSDFRRWSGFDVHMLSSMYARIKPIVELE